MLTLKACNFAGDWPTATYDISLEGPAKYLLGARMPKVYLLSKTTLALLHKVENVPEYFPLSVDV